MIKKNKILSPLLIIFLLSLLIKIVGLFSNKSLHFDEAVIWGVAKRPLIDIITGNFYEYRFHGPLFYTLMHFWIKVSQYEIWLRIPSIIFNLLSLITLFLLARKILGVKSAIISALLFSTSAYHSYWSLQSRVYEGVCFFSILYTLLAVYALEKNRLKLWFILALTGCIGISFDYSFIWAYIAVNAYIIFIFAKNKIRITKYLSSNLIFLSIFLYYLNRIIHITLESANALGYTSEVNIYSTVRLMIYFLNINYLNFNQKFNYWNNTIFESLSFILLIFLLRQVFIIQKKRKLLIVLITFLPLISSFFISQFYPIFIHYNLIFVSIGIILLLSTVTNKSIKIIIITIWFFINFLSFRNYLLLDSNEDWKSLLPMLKRFSKSHEFLIYPSYFQLSLQYYNNIYNLGINSIYPMSDFNSIEQLRRNTKYCLLVRKYDSHYEVFDKKYLSLFYNKPSVLVSGIEVYCKED